MLNRLQDHNAIAMNAANEAIQDMVVAIEEVMIAETEINFLKILIEPFLNRRVLFF
jgi:hypothetical protein